MKQRDSFTPRRRRLTPKQRVLKRYRCAGIKLSAMHGWQVANYAFSQHDPIILASSSRSEAEAWRNAARKL